MSSWFICDFEIHRGLLEAIEKAGRTPGEDIEIALDCAANEFHKDGQYTLEAEGKTLDAAGMAEIYSAWVDSYPIRSIEDPLFEDDWSGWKVLTEAIGDKVQVVGDDLFVTSVARLERGIGEGIANSILIKVNQIGTLSETFEAINRAARAGRTTPPLSTTRLAASRTSRGASSYATPVVPETRAARAPRGSRSRPWADIGSIIWSNVSTPSAPTGSGVTT